MSNDRQHTPQAHAKPSGSRLALSFAEERTQAQLLAVQDVLRGVWRGVQIVASDIALGIPPPQRPRHKHACQQQQVAQAEQAYRRVPQQQEVALRVSHTICWRMVVLTEQ